MSEVDDLLCEEASRMMAASRVLRADRASMGSQCVRALAEHQRLREANSAESHRCQERRQVLDTAIDRWVYVVRVFYPYTP